MTNNKDSYQILQPNRIKIAAITPCWSYREYLSLASKHLFNNNEQIKLNIEKKIKTIHNINFEHSYFFNSARSAVYFTLISLGIKKGDKVIVPSFTCRALLFALLKAEVEPIFADIDEDYNLDLESLIQLDDFNNIKAIVLPNMFGKLNRNYSLIATIKKKGIIIIEDNATAFGSSYNTEILSDAVIYSFNIGKILNSSGGGVVFMRQQAGSKELDLIHDSQIVDTLKIFIKYLIVLRYRKKLSYIKSFFRKRNKNDISLDDYYSSKDRDLIKKSNFFVLEHISPLNLLLINSQLKEFHKLQGFYNSLNRKYNSVFSIRNRFKKNELPNYFVLEIDKKINRYSLGDYLSENGVEVFWSYFPIHMIKLYKDIRIIGNLTVTEEKWNHFLYLPFNQFVKDQDLKVIGKYYYDFLKKYG